jgi:hypothetical protein
MVKYNFFRLFIISLGLIVSLHEGHEFAPATPIEGGILEPAHPTHAPVPIERNSDDRDLPFHAGAHPPCAFRDACDPQDTDARPPTKPALTFEGRVRCIIHSQTDPRRWDRPSGDEPESPRARVVHGPLKDRGYLDQATPSRGNSTLIGNRETACFLPPLNVYSIHIGLPADESNQEVML